MNWRQTNRRTSPLSREFDPRDTEVSIFDALIEARARFGAKTPILEDQERNPLTLSLIHI